MDQGIVAAVKASISWSGIMISYDSLELLFQLVYKA
jgi:hypothetical protein